MESREALSESEGTLEIAANQTPESLHQSSDVKQPRAELSSPGSQPIELSDERCYLLSPETSGEKAEQLRRPLQAAQSQPQQHLSTVFTEMPPIFPQKPIQLMSNAMVAQSNDKPIQYTGNLFSNQPQRRSPDHQNGFSLFSNMQRQIVSDNQPQAPTPETSFQSPFVQQAKPNMFATSRNSQAVMACTGLQQPTPNIFATNQQRTTASNIFSNCCPAPTSTKTAPNDPKPEQKSRHSIKLEFKEPNPDKTESSDSSNEHFEEVEDMPPLNQAPHSRKTQPQQFSNKPPQSIFLQQPAQTHFIKMFDTQQSKNPVGFADQPIQPPVIGKAKTTEPNNPHPLNGNNPRNSMLSDNPFSFGTVPQNPNNLSGDTGLFRSRNDAGNSNPFKFSNNNAMNGMNNTNVSSDPWASNACCGPNTSIFANPNPTNIFEPANKINSRASSNSLFNSPSAIFGNPTASSSFGANPYFANPFMSNPSMYGWGCNPFLNTVPVPSSVYYQMMETNQRVYELQVENNRLRAANQNLQRQLNQHELDLEYTRKQHMRVLEQSRREKHHQDHHDHETSSVEHSQNRKRSNSRSHTHLHPQLLTVKEHITIQRHDNPNNIFSNSLVEKSKAKYSVKVESLKDDFCFVEALRQTLMDRMVLNGTNSCLIKLQKMEGKDGKFYATIETTYWTNTRKDMQGVLQIEYREKSVRLSGNSNGYAIWKYQSMFPGSSSMFKLEGYDRPLKLDKIESKEVQVVLFPNLIMNPMQLKRFCAMTGGKFQYLRERDDCTQELRIHFSKH